MASSEPDEAPSEEEAHARLVPQLRSMLRALWASNVGRTLLLLAAGLFLVIVATAYGQVRLNRWNRPFYDAISRRDFFAFLYELGVFAIIAGSLLVLNVTQAWVQEMLKLKLREGLVRDLLHGWMIPRRALMVANAGSIGVNPDQRMHEDARRLCELSTDLGSGLLQSSILLVTFVGVLWVLSRRFVFHVGEHAYPLPGYMVWAAIVYACFGSLLSYRVGRTLIPRNAERYNQEAELRFSLVRVNEHLDGISLAHGEEGELRRVEMHLGGVLKAMRRLVTGLTNLTWVTAGFGWVTIVAPIIVASPLYFEGTLSFGGMMQAAAAFSQAQSSLSWFVNNFSSIADWRAILLRVANFRRALQIADTVGPAESRIDYIEGQPGMMVLENLHIAAPHDSDVLQEPRVEVHAGERLVVVAEPGTNKTRLFRALAGLWPWGSGRIIRPSGETMHYLPRGTPYLPRGSLREILAYPQAIENFEIEGYALALRRVGLDRLIPQLDETHRWDRELSQEEQFGLAFARIVLQRPPWLIVDDTLGSLDAEMLDRVIDIFSHELTHTAVIHVGSAATRDPLFTRRAHLVKPSRARRFPRSMALMLLIALAWPALSHAAAPGERFGFNAPTILNDAHAAMVMKDLAERVLPVYSEPNHVRYLTNLSALQMVAGDYAAAYATRQALRSQLKGSAAAEPPDESVAYDIFAHTEALQERSHVPFGRAFAQSFNEVVPRLDDLSDYTVAKWLDTPLSLFQQDLQDAFNQVRGQPTLALPQALQLIWTYLAFQVHLNTGPQADELIVADQQQRYITEEDVRIPTPSGPLSAMVVRPRTAGPLPTLLEFTIYVYPDNDALECAAHGYAGVVAYSRGKRVNWRRVVPYTHDGADARRVIRWIAQQPWSDKRVGMYGRAYSGFTAWAAAQRPEPALRAIAVASPIAPGITEPMRGNIFLNSSLRWSRYVSDTITQDETAFDDDAHWVWLNQTWYQSGRPYDQLPRIEGHPNPVFSQWLRHPSYDRYWQAMIPYQQQFAHIDIPVLTISGYFDRNEASALYYYTQHHHYDRHANGTLVMGPYDEFVIAGPPPATLLNYPIDPAARLDWHALRFQWFDSIFKSASLPPQLQPGVNFEVMGANHWLHAAAPETMGNRVLSLWLDADGSDLSGGWHRLATQSAAERAIQAARAAAQAARAARAAQRAGAARARRGAGKGRVPALPRVRSPSAPAPAAIVQTVDFAERLDADWLAPWQLQASSVPTHYSVVFAGTPLNGAVQLSGQPSGELDFTTNKMDFDFELELYARLPDGTYLKLFDPGDEYRASYAEDRSHRHLLAAGPVQHLQFRSQHLVSRWLPSGARLVLVLSVVKRPDEEINYGTNQNVAEESIADARVPLRIRWLDTSHVDLPILVSPPPSRPPPRPAPTHPAPTTARGPLRHPPSGPKE